MLGLAACGGSNNGVTISTATPTEASASASATATTMTIAELPAAPESLLAGAAPLSGYLGGGRAGLESCLPEVVLAWGYAPVEGTRCLLADLDGDGEQDYVWVATLPDEGEPGDAWIFLGGRDGFHLATSARALANIELTRVRLLATADLTGDGRPDPVITGERCGASTCTTTFVIVSAHFGALENLSPPDLAVTSIEETAVADETGDGIADLGIRGGTVSSAGGGPPRSERLVLTWGGLQFFERREPDEAQYLIHAIEDADALFAASHFAEARTAYLAAAGDTLLADWKLETTGLPGRPELVAYATFRAGIAAYRDGDATGGFELMTAAGRESSLLHGLAAAAVSEVLGSGQSLDAGCQVARLALAERRDEYIAIWDYGYDNPSHSIDALCG